MNMPDYAAINTKKFLDAAGLAHFAQRLNQYPTNDVIEAVVEGIQDALDEKVDSDIVGANSGIAQLDAGGKLVTTQIPSSVYDVFEFLTVSDFPGVGNPNKIYISAAENCSYRWNGSAYVQLDHSETLSIHSGYSGFPAIGDTNKLYIDTSTNKIYRTDGSNYIELSPSLQLGETSSTAYRGDYGAAAYAHAVTNKGSAFTSGLYKITTNSEGHVTDATAATKSDITGLGVPAQDTTYTLTQSQQDAHILMLTGTNGNSTSVTTADTAVTAEENHYTPESDATSQITANAGDASPEWGFDVVKGLTLTRDSKGHVTGLTVTSGKLPSLGTTSTTAAAGNHVHITSIAPSSSTTELTLGPSTQYNLAAGGTSFIFTTPPDTTYTAISDAEIDSIWGSVPSGSASEQQIVDTITAYINTTEYKQSIANMVSTTGSTEVLVGTSISGNKYQIGLQSQTT